LSLSFFFFSSSRRHTRSKRDWSSDVCSSDLLKNLSFYSYIYYARFAVNQVVSPIERESPMPNPAEQILVSHAGSLPRTPELIKANQARQFEDDGFTIKSTEEFKQQLAASVKNLVAHQKAQGITVPGDGEFGKAMSQGVDYGAWWSYIFQRVEGLSLTGEDITNQP